MQTSAKKEQAQKIFLSSNSKRLFDKALNFSDNIRVFLDKLFSPKNSIALIGASASEGSVGQEILKNLLSNKAKLRVFPVNPKRESILGEKCYKNLEEIKEIPGLAIIAVPAVLVYQELKKAHERGIENFVIISAGFKEASSEGRLLEEKISKYILKNKLNLLGVNCLGFMNLSIGLNCSFAPITPKKGNVAFVSQSGALCTALIDLSSNYNLGFSKVISTGNKTVMSEIEILEYLENDPETEVIMIYLESLETKDFISKSQKITKPVIVLKAGRSVSGQKATGSHTGSLGGLDEVYDALLRQCGFVRVFTIEEFFNLATVVSQNPMPKGKNVAILTNAGGPGGLAADAVELNGLLLADLSEETKTNLKKYLPTFAGINNPVDILGDAKANRYQVALDLLLADSKVDSVLVILTPQSVTEISKTAKVITRAKEKFSKPVLASFIGDKKMNTAQRIFFKNQVSQITYPDLAIACLSKLYLLSENRQMKAEKSLKTLDSKKNSISPSQITKIKKNLGNLKQKGLKLLNSHIVDPILENYGISVLKRKLVKSETQAETEAEKFNSHLVMKVISPDILHKSDVGGVKLKVRKNKVRYSYNQLMQIVKHNSPKAKISGVLLTEMVEAKNGIEMILGILDQPGVSKSILLGLGGIYVETIRDVTFSVCPVDLNEAERMILRLKTHPLLMGVRSQEPMDVESLKNLIVKISEIAQDFDEIKELDLNPVLVLPQGQGYKILDSRMII